MQRKQREDTEDDQGKPACAQARGQPRRRVGRSRYMKGTAAADAVLEAGRAKRKAEAQAHLDRAPASVCVCGKEVHQAVPQQS